jgi:hypothetical protein
MSKGGQQADPSELLAGLGERMGMPGLKLDAKGTCQLVFDGMWVLTIIHAPARQALLLDCVASPLGHSVDRSTEVLAAALRANFMGQAAAGGWLCIGPDQRAHLQWQTPLAQTTAEQLAAAVSALLQTAETWSQRWASSPGAGLAPSQHPTEMTSRGLPNMMRV